MPADFFIDSQLGVVFSKGTGVFSEAVALDHMTRLLGHPDFNLEFKQLLDFRDVTSMELTNQEVRELAGRSVFSARSQRAFVVSTDLQFGLSRMFGTLREFRGEHGIMIFREMSEAISWLGLAAEPDPELFALLKPPPGDA